MSWKDPIPHHQVERDPSKANLVSPGLLGIPTTPTPVIGIRSEQIANASFVIDTVASAGALLTTTDQDWTGIKKAVNTGACIRAGLRFINNQTSGVGAMIDIENNGSFGQVIYSTRGVGLSVTSLGARAIQLSTLTGEALYSSSKAGANNIVLHNVDGLGANVIASQGFQANGYNYVGQNAGIITFHVDKYGDVLARNITASEALLDNHVVIKKQLDKKADMVSPEFTGVPKAPTAVVGTSTTQIATTAFVMTATVVDQTVIQNSVRAVSGGAVHTALLEKQNLLGYTPENTANKNTSLGYVGLEADLKINPIYLPALPLVDVRPVASEAAMLALPSIKGTVAIRSDINKTFILQGTDAAVLGSWLELLSPTQGVTSVFGRSGPITAAYGDYDTSLIPEGTNLYYTEARVANNSAVIANTADRHKALSLGAPNGLSIVAATQVLSLALSSASSTGALSNTDWNRFNAKQDAINNPITGVLTPNHIAKASSAGELVSSGIVEDLMGNIKMGPLAAKNTSATFSVFASGNDLTYGILLGTDLSGNPVIQGGESDGSDQKNIVLQPLGGQVLVGSNVSTSDSLIQVAGTITAFAGDGPNKVVIGSQLDTKLDKDVTLLPTINPLTGDERVLIEQDGEAKLIDVSLFSSGSGKETVSLVVDKSLAELGLTENATDSQIEDKFEELLLTLPTSTYIDSIEYAVLYVFRLVAL